jgi:hypothetical protein
MFQGSSAARLDELWSWIVSSTCFKYAQGLMLFNLAVSISEYILAAVWGKLHYPPIFHERPLDALPTGAYRRKMHF